MLRVSLLCILLLVGCGKVTEPESSTRGEARVTLFKECMALAASNTRKGDDDVADIVNSCANQSAYMTNYMVK